MAEDCMIDLEKARREELRWMILRALYAAQPIGTTEIIVMKAMEPVVPDVTLLEIRRELDYLSERNLATVSGTDGPVWFAKIGRYGIDIVEYTVPCHPGIARPKKW
jgi:hypothetical protein